MIRLTLNDAGAMARLGAALGRWVLRQPGRVIHLEGDLGAGKTTLARGLLKDLGVTGAVRSPTYTLMEPYETAAGTLIHMDLYRLKSPQELENLGLDSYPPGLVTWLVEWPDRGGTRLPGADLRVRLSHAGERRHAELDPIVDHELKGACEALL